VCPVLPLNDRQRLQEARMYIGGGLITLIVVILLLAWLL
jgi:hypothetical protein